MVQSRRYWVVYGRLCSAAAETASVGPEDESENFHNGHVRITTGELGTEIKWTVISPSTSSLFAVCDWIKTATAPFVLRFFASGWFEEFHDTAEAATTRINEIIARGDRHFTCRTMVKEFELESAPISPFFKSCISGETNAGDYAVECVYEDTSQQFHVERVGPKSTIRRIWGPNLSSFPCQASGSYSESVSRAYSDVILKGRARYDHVLAAMSMPNDDIFWVPYQRLLMPKKIEGERPSVLIFTEISKVSIQLI